MVYREFKPEEFKCFKKELDENAVKNTSNFNYDAVIKIEGKDYILKIQPEGKNKISILHALEIDCEEFGKSYNIITDSKILVALLEVLIWQKIQQ